MNSKTNNKNMGEADYVIGEADDQADIVIGERSTEDTIRAELEEVEAEIAKTKAAAAEAAAKAKKTRLLCEELVKAKAELERIKAEAAAAQEDAECANAKLTAVIKEPCVDSQGRKYASVVIGVQEWMAENLAVTVDRNGEELVLGQDYWYPKGKKEYVKEYGLLYTWDAAMRIAPEGWHLPSDEEWTTLKAYCGRHYALGGTEDKIAKALASAKGWENYGGKDDECMVGNRQSQNNATGFSAFPAGGYNGSYANFGYRAYFWSSAENNSTTAYARNLCYNITVVRRTAYVKGSGFSVRCVRD